MAIFRKSVSELANAVIAIKADTKKEADDAFERFLDGDNEMYEDYRTYMNCSIKESVVDLTPFENEEAYSKSSSMKHDFWIEADRVLKEPRYNLYIVLPDGIRKVYYDKILKELLPIIRKSDEEYILTYCPFSGKPNEFVFHAERRKSINV